MDHDKTYTVTVTRTPFLQTRRCQTLSLKAVLASDDVTLTPDVLLR